MKSSIKDFFIKLKDVDLDTFTAEILNEKLHFLCSVTLTANTLDTDIRGRLCQSNTRNIILF